MAGPSPVLLDRHLAGEIRSMLEERRWRGVSAGFSSSTEWIAGIANDPDGLWRSPWLTACALHALAR